MPTPTPTSSAKVWSLLAVVGICIAIGVADWMQRSAQAISAAPAPAAVWPMGADAVQGEALRVLARGSIPMPEGTPAAHASTLLAMPADSPASLLAFWFAGQRESAPDVQIAMSAFDRKTQQWQAARFVVNRADLGAQLGHGVRRLGNPVAWLDKQGAVHLFVVATGLGGWAAGRVAHLRQVPGTPVEAMRFEAVRVLPLSWLWNTSHLVRNAPLPLEGGGMLLPLYFELGIKYPVAARFGPQGELVGLQRLSAHEAWLQPSVFMRSPTEWVALMRDHSGQRKVGAARSTDAGQTWQDLPPLALDNPDASVAALGLNSGVAVLAHNPSTTGREVLRLSYSADGLQWSPLANLASVPPAPPGQPTAESSYPALAWADGNLWVSYTEQRSRIAWVRLAATPAGAKP